MGMLNPKVLAVAALPAVGAVGVLAAGALASTNADTSTPTTRYAVQCLDPSAVVPVPPAAVFSKTYTGVGAAGVSGTVPAVPKVGAISSTLVRVELTVSFESGTSGTATVRLPAHEYHTAIRFVNAPLTKSLFLGPNAPTNFQVFTQGDVRVRVQVNAYIGAGTQPQQHVVAGTSCAPGETANALVDPAAPAASLSPAPSPSASVSPSASPVSPGSSPVSPGASPASPSPLGLPIPLPLP